MGLALLVWIFLAAIYGSFWLLFFSIFKASRKKESVLLTWLGGLPLALSTTGAVLFVGTMVYGLFSVSQPRKVYEISFGTQPTADVTSMQSSYFTFGDTGTAFLRFKASPSTIDQLTGKGWTRLAGQKWQSETFSFFQGEQTPAWWKPQKTNSTVIYSAEKRFGNFSSESEILTYETTTKQAYYAFIGID